jgi:serine protease Do
LGLVVADLTPAQKTELKVQAGVRVESVQEPAAKAGLREGDLILAVANQEVHHVKDFEAVLAKLDKSKAVNVLFRRGDLTRFALIRPVR